ncbi:RS21-like protein [Mya arenaria]|uniref:RS21-like protein n=1 Tax=Mya arenaria TaxID=6604 RepID=A0ABY7FRM9_MYAAR|nr:RS21-like protein [Mya arenaria]
MWVSCLTPPTFRTIRSSSDSWVSSSFLLTCSSVMYSSSSLTGTLLSFSLSMEISGRLVTGNIPLRSDIAVATMSPRFRQRQIIMQNEAGEFVDISASNRIIGAKDHASIQINFAEVDDTTGRMTGGYKTFAICGAIRRMGESDDCLNRLAKRDGIVAKNF